MAEADQSRRQFLNLMVNAIGAGMTAVLAVPFAGYFLDPQVNPARRGGSKSWVKLGPATDLTKTPKQYAFQTVRTEGFMKQQVNETAFAFLDDSGKPVVISNTCTHLGCPANWDASKNEFFCPCHGSSFDKTGKNVAGPAPRPLPGFEAKLEGGDIYINV